MAKKIKKYKVGLNSETYAISLVEEPAIEETLIALSEQKEIKVQLANEDKHMVYSAVLVPDKPIYRRSDNGNEFYVEFTKESIEQMAQNFFKEFRQSDITLDHQTDATDITVVESWIKADMYKDKSVALGLNEQLPVGTWFCAMKVNNDDVWKRIKAGELNGFSVESMIKLEEFSKVDNDMIETDMNYWDKLKQVLKEAFSKEDTEEVVEAKLEEQTTTTEVKTEEAVETAVEPSKVEEPTPTKEAVKEEPVAKTVEEKEDSTEPKTEPKQEDNHLAELINSLKEEINALKEMNTGLQTKIKDLAKQPSTKPVNTNAKPSAGDTYANWRRQMADYLA